MRTVEVLTTEERAVFAAHAALGSPEERALCGIIERLSNALEAERAEVNTPHTADFIEAVKLEAAHQRKRWGTDHDVGKTDADWFWLIGFLAGKAINPLTTPEKRLHHIITTAAACLNWHAHRTGADTRMRPGIAPPEGIDSITTGGEADCA